jgi:chemotaxis protein histidine kinase CheA/ActR/RegA family two-component response regulator
VTREHDDLLPLFLEEAGSRLERLGGLFEHASTEPEAAVQVRRELHALKGAARLMGLSAVADLCHRAEDCLTGRGAAGFDEACELTNEMRRILDGLGGDVPQTGSGATARVEHEHPGIRGGSGELRVATRVVDGLAERSARMRVTARSGAAAVHRLFELAAAAEQGAAEDSVTEIGPSIRSVALELEATLKQLQRFSDEQLDATLRLQVQPLRPFLRTLARHTRELAGSLGKEVAVSTSGGNVQLDRRILEAIREAALHLVHNAVDHGIEDAEDRRRAGKNPIGKIHLGAEADGDRVRLVVRDDGRGIDPESILRLAVERGLIDPSAASQLGPNEVYQLLELPGFTTRALATDVSGRGVGLDAVAASFRAIGGDLWIRSLPGSGSRVTAELPVARRGERVLIVRVGSYRLAVPSAGVRSFSRISPERIVSEDGRCVFQGDRGPVSVVVLAEMFDVPLAGNTTLVETVVGGTATGIVVDEIVGEEEVFVRPVPAISGAPAFIEGIALLASGLPVSVLSPSRLGPLELGVAAPRRRPSDVRILLTDDTAATREMTRRMLEDAGFDVVAVSAAEEALDLVETEPFDGVITGVELPGLSGIELTSRIRSSDLYADLPVVVISTRDRPADRLAGLEAGADAYLTKRDLEPGQLVTLVRRLTDASA